MAAVNVASVVSEIAAQVVPLVAVGGAVLLVAVAWRTFFWLQDALSGSDGDYDDNRAADWEQDGGGMIYVNEDGSRDTWYAATDRWERS